jgi:hypothetical protein
MMFRPFAALCPCCRGSGQVQRPVRLCLHCGSGLDDDGGQAHRPRLYCSARCRSAAHRLREAMRQIEALEAFAARLGTAADTERNG